MNNVTKEWVEQIQTGAQARKMLLDHIALQLSLKDKYELGCELPQRASIHKVTVRGEFKHWSILLDDDEGTVFEGYSRGCAADAAHLFLCVLENASPLT